MNPMEEFDVRVSYDVCSNSRIPIFYLKSFCEIFVEASLSEISYREIKWDFDVVIAFF